MTKKVNKILYVVAECVPFAKSGGEADVAGAFPAVLKKRGYDVKVFMPMHGLINKDQYNFELVCEGLTEKVGRKEYKFDVYKAISYDGVEVYFLHNHLLFGSRKNIYGYKDDNLRFYLFDRVALRFAQVINWEPEVIHCNDWHAGMIPYFLNFDDSFSNLQNSATLFTIHNLAYQKANVHEYFLKYGLDDGEDLVEPTLAYVRRLNFAKRAIRNADYINAVSKQYAQEILTEEFGMNLERDLIRQKKKLIGILNGVDYLLFNPLTDPYLKYHYDENDLTGKANSKEFLQKKFGLPREPEMPLLGIVSRLVGHKGFDLMGTVIKVLLSMPVQIVITGTGEKQYVKLFEKLAKKYPKKIATHLELDLEVASQIYAGSDMFLMPSKFEPCGLAQLIALRYGSIPVVHEVGGLADTIKDFDVVTKTGNGFVFDNYDELSFYGAIVRALEHYKNKDVWIPLVKNGMRERFSWEDSADLYEKIYQKAYLNKKKNNSIL